MAEEIPEVHLNPMKVFSELEELLPSDAILVADGGDFVATAAYILRYVLKETLIFINYCNFPIHCQWSVLSSFNSELYKYCRVFWFFM